MLITVAQKKVFDALNATQKKLSFMRNTVSEKIKKKRLKMVIFDHFDHFEMFFLIFLGNGTSQRAEVFCDAFRASTSFF